MTNRKEQNAEILKRLTEFFNKPETEDIRFFQGLSILGLFNTLVDKQLNVIGVEDPFHQESSTTLDKIQSRLDS